LRHLPCRCGLGDDLGSLAHGSAAPDGVTGQEAADHPLDRRVAEQGTMKRRNDNILHGQPLNGKCEAVRQRDYRRIPACIAPRAAPPASTNAIRDASPDQGPTLRRTGASLMTLPISHHLQQAAGRSRTAMTVLRPGDACLSASRAEPIILH
jgi:hypothetical protein